MTLFRDSNDDSETDKPQTLGSTAQETDALDGLEELGAPPQTQGHLVPAYVFEQADRAIAGVRSVKDSRLDETKDYPAEAVKYIAKGDIGEGYTFVRLLERHEGNQIVAQPRGLVDASGQAIRPDFAVRSTPDSQTYQEIVDAKAWSVLYPHNASGPDAPRLANMSALRDTVQRYSSSPQLAAEGSVVLYFPEEVLRHTPHAVSEIESWSGTALAHGRNVQVRSMGVWNDQLWQATWQRLRESRG